MDGMDEHLASAEAASKPAPQAAEKPMRPAKAPWRRFSYFAAFLLLAALSTFAGFFVARFQGAITNWLRIHPVAAADSRHAKTELVSTPQPAAKDSGIEEISHLA